MVNDGENPPVNDGIPEDPPGTYRDDNGRLRDSETNRFVEDPRTNRTNTGNDANAPVADGERPSWRQSELDAEGIYPDYDTQASFIDGQEVPYGTEGSTRPDLYTEGHAVEVKNYDVETPAGRRNLVRELGRQYDQRLVDLPEGTNQTVVVDVRGQVTTPELLIDIETSITNRCPTLEVIFMQ